MKIPINRFKFKDYATRVLDKSKMMQWVGNVHLRTRYTPAGNSGVELLERKRLDESETEKLLQKFTELKNEVFAADQSDRDTDRALAFSDVKLDSQKDTYRISRTTMQPGDPTVSFELQTADIDKYGKVSSSIAMRSGPGGLEVVEKKGSLTQEYVFRTGEAEATQTLFAADDSYDTATFGDKALNYWNSFF